MSESVRIETHPTADGHHIGVLTLDSPASLNALSLPMIQALQRELTRCEQDPGVVCVLLQGAGEKAFCAGGDIRSFYYRKQEESEQALFDYARDFFEQEYRLDHHIHRYGKPLICVADGIVWGGIGLFAGADFRVVTEKSLFAMPEVTIGLYPDVGASWFLSRMPGRLGLWLGLTGARFNGADAIGLGLADHAIASSERAALLPRLAGLDWCGSQAPREQIDQLLRGLQAEADKELPAPVLLPTGPKLTPCWSVAPCKGCWTACLMPASILIWVKGAWRRPAKHAAVAAPSAAPFCGASIGRRVASRWPRCLPMSWRCRSIAC